MKHQRGFAFAESLMAIFIFSIGLVGLLGFRSVAVQEVTESKVRTNASYLAGALVSQMWTNRANLAQYNWAGGSPPAAMTDWYSTVQRELPGSSELPPIVQVGSGNEVSIVMRWQLGGPTGYLRQFRLNTQILDP